MSSFNNVKVGDTILHKVAGLRIGGFDTAPSFWVPVPVERVTATQFVVEGGRRYKKSNGSEIGAKFSFAAHEGDEAGWGRLCKDETDDLVAHNYRVKLWYRCLDAMDNLREIARFDGSDLPALSVALDAALAAAKNEVPSE